MPALPSHRELLCQLFRLALPLCRQEGRLSAALVQVQLGQNFEWPSCLSEARSRPPRLSCTETGRPSARLAAHSRAPSGKPAAASQTVTFAIYCKAAKIITIEIIRGRPAGPSRGLTGTASKAALIFFIATSSCSASQDAELLATLLHEAIQAWPRDALRAPAQAQASRCTALLLRLGSGCGFPAALQKSRTPEELR